MAIIGAGILEQGLTGLAREAGVVLRWVWHGQRFSWWISNRLQDFDGEVATGMASEAFAWFLGSERDDYLWSEEGRKVLAREYVGLLYGTIK